MSSKYYFLNRIILMLAIILYSCLTYYYFSVAEWSWYIIPVVLYAWFSADFVLGISHLYLDYTACPNNIGLKELSQYSKQSTEYMDLKKKLMSRLSFIERISFDFKTHHAHPRALGNRPFSKLVAETLITHVIPVLIFLSITVYFNYLHHLVLLYFLVISLGFLLGQYAHANTHKEVVPLPIKALQFMRIFLTAKHHNLHHKSFNRTFCILNGWADILIDPIARYMLYRGWLNRENLELH